MTLPRHTLLAGALLTGVVLAAGPTGAEQRQPPGVGLSCQADRACPGYLRCLSGHCAVPPAVTGQSRPGTPRVVFEVLGGRPATFSVEVVDDDYEHQRGMMFRDRLAPGWGMLFLYPAEQVHSFWMRNTYVPLDMVFLGADGRVRGVVEWARPLDPTSLAIAEPSRDVLEVAAGTARRLGIRAGVAFSYVGVVRPP